MHRLETRFSEWVMRYRLAIIVLSIVVVAASSFGVQYLGFTPDYRVYFREDSPHLIAFNQNEATYTKSDNVFILVEPENGDVFQPEYLALIEALTEEAWQIPHSRRVDSIQNYQNTYAEEDDLIVEDLYVDAESLAEEDIEYIKSIALTEPLLFKRMISKDGRATAVNVTIEFPEVDPQGELREVVAYSRELVKKYQEQYPNVRFYVTGMAFMNNAFVESGQSDGSTLFPISFLVMVLFLVFLLRSLSAVFGVTLIILMSTATAFGLGGYAGVLLTPGSVSSGQMIMVLAVANSVHMLVTFIFDLQHNVAKVDALKESLRINMLPIILTSVTTIIGFLGMNFNESAPYRDLGNLVAVGVFVSMVLSLTFLPAMMSFLPVRVKLGEDGSVKYLEKLSLFSIKYHRRLLIVMCVVAVISSVGIPLNTSEEHFTTYFDKTVQFRIDSDATLDIMGGTFQLTYSMPAETAGGVSEPEYLQNLEKFATWYREQPETISVFVFTDTMRRLNKNMHGDDPDKYTLPESRELAAQYMLLYEMSLPYGLDLNNQVNVDKSATRVVVTIQDMTNNELMALEDRAQAWLRENAPASMKTTGTGTLMMFSHLADTNTTSMIVGSVLALIIISAILMFALRSFKMGLFSLMTNILPAAIGFGLWGVLSGEVHMGLSVVVSMTLGIVVDDSVHFLSKYLRAKREKGYTTEQSITYAFTHVGKALSISTLVLVAGFGTLMASHFAMTTDMAILTVWIIIAALVANFLFLPGLLIKFDKEKP
ncbi:MAG: RND transporter [Cycloclasticus sp.]|nr:RND transporter [Cycloclasticus sp.]MBG96072.1 RND transporter [Cycloclasticus sp.]HAI96023.1 RND transporter [Methylococcaceae bacterium]|tara:strand:+ start:4948 stop:7245 length:2298 start_codon:yes stop_codon:yes gene_type:complete